MKKNKKNATIFSISLVGLSFVSYKILKKTNPEKIDNLKQQIKNLYNSKNKKNETENLEKKETLPVNNIENINSKNTNNDNSFFNIKINNVENDSIDNLENTSLDIITENIVDITTENKEDKEFSIKHTKQDIEEHTNKHTESITIPDGYIEDEIRYQLCLSSKDPIDRNILSKLKRIDFFEINDIDISIYCEFLSEYTQIKSIVIDNLNPLKYNDNSKDTPPYCHLKDISPINKLEYLEELSFNWGIENIDFSVLENLPNLKKLEIKFGMLSNIDFLSKFENLEYLEVMLSNNISNFSPITNLDKLKSLYIYTNSKIDNSMFKNMKNLDKLYINGENITFK